MEKRGRGGLEAGPLGRVSQGLAAALVHSPRLCPSGVAKVTNSRSHRARPFRPSPPARSRRPGLLARPRRPSGLCAGAGPSGASSCPRGGRRGGDWRGCPRVGPAQGGETVLGSRAPAAPELAIWAKPGARKGARLDPREWTGGVRRLKAAAGRGRGLRTGAGGGARLCLNPWGRSRGLGRVREAAGAGDALEPSRSPARRKRRPRASGLSILKPGRGQLLKLRIWTPEAFWAGERRPGVPGGAGHRAGHRGGAHALFPAGRGHPGAGQLGVGAPRAGRRYGGGPGTPGTLSPRWEHWERLPGPRAPFLPNPGGAPPGDPDRARDTPGLPARGEPATEPGPEPAPRGRRTRGAARTAAAQPARPGPHAPARPGARPGRRADAAGHRARGAPAGGAREPRGSRGPGPTARPAAARRTSALLRGRGRFGPAAGIRARRPLPGVGARPAARGAVAAAAAGGAGGAGPRAGAAATAPLRLRPRRGARTGDGAGAGAHSRAQPG